MRNQSDVKEGQVLEGTRATLSICCWTDAIAPKKDEHERDRMEKVAGLDDFPGNFRAGFIDGALTRARGRWQPAIGGRIGGNRSESLPAE